jgi:hypothetical protein
MANITVHALAELAAAPASDDELGIWDLSAGIYKRITITNLFSTVPLLTAAQTWLAAQTFDAPIKVTKSTLTISGGVVTVSKPQHDIDTEGAAASDDLDTMNGGTQGQRVIIGTVSSARDVVIKNGTGNIFTASGADVTLASSSAKREFIYDASNWREIG